MKSYSEIRTAAWNALREGGWVMRFLVVWMVMMTLFGMVQYAWNEAVATMGIQTWSMFLEAKAQAISSGLDLTVPSRRIAISMTEASAFEIFVGCIISGILSFAVAGLFLRAAKSKPERWFASSFDGFKCPLGLAWLYFRYMLQLLLWSLLFVLPGIMAYYRYCQAWNLKSENPDWSAGKCLSESARMMKGHKAQRFALDLSYWKPLALLSFGLVAAIGLSGTPVLGSLGRAVAFLLSLACMWGGVVLSVYLSIGRAMFYLDLKGQPQSVR